MHLQYAVASFCDPEFHLRLDRGPQKERLREDLQNDPRLRLAFGVHPKHATGFCRHLNTGVDRLRRLMSLPGVVAFGEVGLDYTVPSAEWESQRKMLTHLLKELRGEIGGKPLVIHCREAVSPTPQKAEEDLLAILRREVPADQPIQVHYFNGNKTAVDRWLQAFPNTYFSVGGAATTFTQQQKEGLAHIPKDRFLLESDAPYAAPQMAAKGVTKRRLISHPYTLVQVAWVVAEVHQTAVSIVLNQTARNARRFFGLEDPAP